jgi:hypothetical protein
MICYEKRKKLPAKLSFAILKEVKINEKLFYSAVSTNNKDYVLKEIKNGVANCIYVDKNQKDSIFDLLPGGMRPYDRYIRENLYSKNKELNSLDFI